MSFAEWTATSMRPSRSASSSSFTNTPRSPISPNGFVRSRSPAVVIGMRAISMPGCRNWSAANSACVSASLLPRLPIRRSMLLLPEPEEVPRRLDVPGAVSRRGLLQAHDRDVQELVHDLRRQGLHGSTLALGKPAEPPLRLRELARANGLRPLTKRGDRGDDVERGLPVAEASHLVRD